MCYAIIYTERACCGTIERQLVPDICLGKDQKLCHRLGHVREIYISEPTSLCVTCEALAKALAEAGNITARQARWIEIEVLKQLANDPKNRAYAEMGAKIDRVLSATQRVRNALTLESIAVLNQELLYRLQAMLKSQAEKGAQLQLYVRLLRYLISLPEEFNREVLLLTFGREVRPVQGQYATFKGVLVHIATKAGFLNFLTAWMEGHPEPQKEAASKIPVTTAKFIKSSDQKTDSKPKGYQFTSRGTKIGKAFRKRPEAKSAAKPEVQPEGKPEVQPEGKPEVKW